MPNRGCLIIDDVHGSLSKMTDLGRTVASVPAEEVRDAVVEFAKRRGWAVLRYRTYAEWAFEMMSGDQRTWLILDPLFPFGRAEDWIHSVRLTRRFDGNQTRVDRGDLIGHCESSLNLSELSGEIGIVDDAAASGTTLKHLAQLVGQSGEASVSRVLVAASSRGACDSFRAVWRTARWSEFILGDWQVVHLRDGCPHLPYSGRPTGQPAIRGIDGSLIEVRAPSTRVAGNLWQVMSLDKGVCEAIANAHVTIAQKLGGVLGRAACVRDLGLLGRFVPALANTGASVADDTTLASLSRHASPAQGNNRESRE